MKEHPHKYEVELSEDQRFLAYFTLALLAQLPRSRGTDAGTRIAGRSHHDLPLGTTLCPRTGETMQAAPQSSQ